MTESEKYPRFISNSPNGVDLFESRSQEKTAKSISEHIKLRDKDYRLIGLDGEWGSGKSNAISIVQKQLGDDFHLFVYDTWAHQEDLQRRSFLEELTDDLQKNHVINQAEWKTKLSDLLAKKKVTVTKTIPTLSYGILVSLLVAVIVPIAKVISEGISPDKQLLRVLITGSPLLVALIVWGIAAIKDPQYRKLVHLFRIYEKQDLKKISDETISESEPSLREFRNWIYKLNDDSQKCIVVVFDNMDRLSSEKIKIIWTLLHTFFSSQPYSKIWVIVPFDREHIREALGNSDSDEDFERTNHLINKTFSVIFNISPAALTDWKKFFEQKYKDAFGETEMTEYSIARKVFDLYNTSITPRKIISFINDLVSLKLIWEKEIKLRYIALFVLNRQKISKSPVTQILNKSFLEGSQNIFNSDEAVSDNIAALFYNVPLEKATQITLQREIELAIRNKNIDELRQYSKNTDFVSILEQIQTEDIDVEPIVFCLSEIQPSLENSDSEVLQVIWDRVIGKQLKMQLADLEFTEYQKILVLKARPANQRILVNYFLKQFYNIREFSGSKYFLVLSGIESLVKENNIEIEIESLIQRKVVLADVFIDYLNSAKENYQKFKVLCEKDALEKYFIDKFPESLNNASVISFIKEEYKFQNLKQTIENFIEGNNVTISNVAIVFDAYKATSEHTTLNAKLTDPKIYELLIAAKKYSKEYYELAAMRIARADSFLNQGTEIDDILSNTTDGFLKEMVVRVEHYKDFGSLLIDSISWPKPALISVLNKMISGDEGNCMDIEDVIPHFRKIVSTLKTTDEILLNKLNGWEEHLKTTLTKDNILEVIPDQDFYKIALSIKNDITEYIISVASDFLEYVTYESWIESYKDQKSYLFNLLYQMLEANKINALPNNAFIAYKDALQEIATSSGNYNISKGVQNMWLSIYKKVDKFHLQSHIKDIRDLFLRDFDITDEQFLFFEPIFREIGGLTEKSGEVVRKILNRVINNSESLARLLEFRDIYLPIIIAAGDDAFGLIDAARLKIETEPENNLLIDFLNEINEHLSNSIKIISGRYFSPRKNEDNGIDITDTLKRIVEIEKKLHFKVDNGITNGNDPDEGNQKNLSVKYSYNDAIQEKTFEEHKWFRLP